MSVALLPGGRLFLGTADRVDELNALFAPVRPAASFAFVHRAAGVAADAQPRAAVPVRHIGPGTRSSAPAVRPAAEDRSARATEADAESLHAATALLKRALEHRQRGELAKAERRCRQALYLAPNLLPALELLQILWSEHPNLRMRRALRDRVLRNRGRRPAANEAPAAKENA